MIKICQQIFVFCFCPVFSLCNFFWANFLGFFWAPIIFEYLFKLWPQIYSNICFERFQSFKYICIFVWWGLIFFFYIFKYLFQPLFTYFCLYLGYMDTFFLHGFLIYQDLKVWHQTKKGTKCRNIFYWFFHMFCKTAQCTLLPGNLHTL